MRPALDALTSRSHDRSCSLSKAADQWVIRKPTSCGGRQASATIRTASASERERAGAPIVERPPAPSRGRRRISARATSPPSADARPRASQCRWSVRHPPSAEPLGRARRCVFRLSPGASPLRDPPADQRTARAASPGVPGAAGGITASDQSCPVRYSIPQSPAKFLAGETRVRDSLRRTLGPPRSGSHLRLDAHRLATPAAMYRRPIP
jgi:hypothetical protein